MFTPLNLPKANLKLSRKGESVYVWDVFRKKKLLLTPEEWVRQHFFHFLVNERNVPQGLISSEYGLVVNQLQRRCDGVIFGRDGKALAIIECKAPEVSITKKTFYQIAQYNFKLNVKWLFMTNGLKTVPCFVDTEKKNSKL